MICKYTLFKLFVNEEGALKFPRTWPHRTEFNEYTSLHLDMTRDLNDY